jgi:hypothetical protein
LPARKHLRYARGAVEKSEGPRTGSASRRAVAHAATSRMTPARRSGSPHLSLTLPPRFARTHALAPCIATKRSRNPRVREPAPQRAPLLHLLFLFRVGRKPRAAPGRHISGSPSHQRVRRPCTCTVPHPRVEKCEGPRTGSAARAACAHAVPSRETAARLFASPHLGLPLPPRVGRPCTYAVPHTGREMRESENRPRSARFACTRMLFQVGRQLCAGSGRRLSGFPSSPRACQLLAAWAKAEEFEGAPPPPPFIAPLSDTLGGCTIGAASLASSCARPRARPP